MLELLSRHPHSFCEGLPASGGTSAGVRLRTAVALDGEAPVTRPVTRQGPEAADLDEHSGIAIVDRAGTAGDAVTPTAGAGAELVRRGCDFGDGVTEVTARVAVEGPQEPGTGKGPGGGQAAVPGPFVRVSCQPCQPWRAARARAGTKLWASTVPTPVAMS
ncbi:hypothetical protein HGI09_16520 [Streptomyces collinus]|nr:hypothetical protein HGI10_47600 [Streptomyces collinus]UJA14347.1 hypothetical protein HGI09_16520 [Streptomyces collinus]